MTLIPIQRHPRRAGLSIAKQIRGCATMEVACGGERVKT